MSRALSLAGFQLILIGRFWVIPEAEENVKVRLHRGHAMMRDWLFSRVGTSGKNAFQFMGGRCDRVVHEVFARLGESSTDRQNGI